jgi:hypothetical protein
VERTKRFVASLAISTRSPAIERDVVVMRLANELEDHLDLGMLYCGEQKRTWSSGSERCRLMVDIARRLGFPKLADELQQAIEETAVAVHSIRALAAERQERVVCVGARIPANG